MTKDEARRRLIAWKTWPTPAEEGWLLVGKYRQPYGSIIEIWMNFNQKVTLRKLEGFTQQNGDLGIVYDAMEFEHRIGSEVLLEVAC